MSFLFGNVRGMNSPTRKLNIMNQIVNFKVSDVALFEHKLHDEDIKILVSGCYPGWSFCINDYPNEKSRICVKTQIIGNLISSREFCITLGAIKLSIPLYMDFIHMHKDKLYGTALKELLKMTPSLGLFQGTLMQFFMTLVEMV